MSMGRHHANSVGPNKKYKQRCKCAPLFSYDYTVCYDVLMIQAVSADNQDKPRLTPVQRAFQFFPYVTYKMPDLYTCVQKSTYLSE